MWNRRLILRLLVSEGPFSRLRIAERTGIQTPSVTHIIKDLLQHRILRTAGKESANRVGRRHVLLEINPDYGWSVGVSLQHNDSVDVVVMDAAQRVRTESVLILKLSGEDLATNLHRLMGRLPPMEQPSGKLLGIGVGLPGIVDTERQTVLNSTYFKLRDYPLGALLQQHVGASVWIDHNVHLAAHAERHFGCARDLTDFLFFMMNPCRSRAGRMTFSYGTALHLCDQVYRGAHFAAGELNTVLAPTVDFSAQQGEALLDALALEKGPTSPLLRRLAGSLAKALAPVANLLDPGAIVLGSEIAIRRLSFLRMVEKELRDRMITVRNRRVRILTSSMGTHAVATGAALRAWEAGLHGREIHRLATDRKKAQAQNNASP